MHFRSVVAASAFAATTLAQRPSDTPICDYYTTALLKNNTAANQKVLLTAVVNTAVIGTFPIAGVNTTGKVAGILAAGKVNDTDVNLLPYFNGGFASSNRGGSSGVAMNFLDGGGAAPLMKLMPANDTSSNQYMLLNHLYEYFGVLLGCTQQGQSDFAAYDGEPSQYNVHKFMDLSYAEVTYFINQVAASAKSFGVADSDLTGVGTALNSLFNVKCAPNATVVTSQGAQQQSICTGDNCPDAPGAVCAAYSNGTAPVQPSVAVASLVPNTTSTTTGSTSTSTGKNKNGAGLGVELSLLAMLSGAFAMLL